MRKKGRKVGLRPPLFGDLLIAKGGRGYSAEEASLHPYRNVYHAKKKIGQHEGGGVVETPARPLPLPNDPITEGRG